MTATRELFPSPPAPLQNRFGHKLLAVNLTIGGGLFIAAGVTKPLLWPVLLGILLVAAGVVGVCNELKSDAQEKAAPKLAADELFKARSSFLNQAGVDLAPQYFESFFPSARPETSGLIATAVGTKQGKSILLALQFADGDFFLETAPLPSEVSR